MVDMSDKSLHVHVFQNSQQHSLANEFLHYIDKKILAMNMPLHGSLEVTGDILLFLGNV